MGLFAVLTSEDQNLETKLKKSSRRMSAPFSLESSPSEESPFLDLRNPIMTDNSIYKLNLERITRNRS